LEVSGGAILSQGGATVLVLSTEVAMDLADASASTTVTLTQGQELGFAVAQCDPWGSTPKPWSRRQIRRRLRATEAGWRSWSRLHQRYDGPPRELVHHSGVVLQGLTYARSGAMVTAPTTSLPEGVGSGRTWDYRFTWVRDASMTLQGLFIAACPDEAGRFFSFLSRAAGTQLDRGLDLQIMYGVGGERDLSEQELPRLSGWRGCGPVRVSNQAWGQRQLDVYGAVLDAAYTLRAQLSDLAAGTRMFLVAAVEAAATRWREDDQLDRGWNDQVGAFTQYFGPDTLDASVLMMAIIGFTPPDDPRLLATIDAIEADLADERGLLYRYRGGDGIDAGEGSFLLCTFWLAHALAVTGQVHRSRDVLERAAGFASPLGLFSEQVDTATGELVGNFPQAFSHLGLVTAAQALADAEHAPPRRRADGPTPSPLSLPDPEDRSLT
jgi:GH15 family glucan-1,4-alpha-glucosidase